MTQRNTILKNPGPMAGRSLALRVIYSLFQGFGEGLGVSQESHGFKLYPRWTRKRQGTSLRDVRVSGIEVSGVYIRGLGV